MKMLEYVPKAIPTISTKLKSRRTLPPKKNSANTGSSVDSEVMSVRESVWLTDASTNSR